ncbi:HEPN domain-containing protein [Candidatus Saganbacteria bacterium CG08_land_8_20_14_0_20_45_16]|uniref:HEPN domain-containing protein n=1 Tax=Candidatus Saganbacteria bacterium CG08_land_8_20_14_0_20_45_16 TaxID=2014293 RepID=A0A2H0Y0W6_UNCSA|nr:MAG: HEPN domain-containing protein [Candidatus Saganbacteria bacterium CG08_land_8_20_14_0_20_45_16]
MKEEVTKLIYKAERSLKAAENLFDDKDYDFAVSRAYYAMFYAAEALLLTKDLSFSKHSGVVAGFWEHFIKNGILPKELHQIFHNALEERNISDYGFEIPFPEDEAREILDNAARFIKACKEYLQSPCGS